MSVSDAFTTDCCLCASCKDSQHQVTLLLSDSFPKGKVCIAPAYDQGVLLASEAIFPSGSVLIWEGQASQQPVTRSLPSHPYTLILFRAVFTLPEPCQKMALDSSAAGVESSHLGFEVWQSLFSLSNLEESFIE